jgi:hypothetical protein
LRTSSPSSWETPSSLFRTFFESVARLADRGAFPVQALLPLLQLEVQQAQGLLVRLDLAEPDIRLDRAPVELAVELGALVLDVRLRLLLHLARGHRRLAAGHLDQLGGLLVGQPPGVPRHYPDYDEADQPPEKEGKGERGVSEPAWQVGCYFGYGF